MHLFYTPDLAGETSYRLNEQESAHCVRVLRMKEGSEVLLSNGAGSIWRAEIVSASPKACICELKEPIEPYDRRDYTLRIGIAPTKNNARTEWFVEKATELGIDEVSLFRSTHSERTVIKPERLEKVAISALKQSYKAFLPKISPLQPLKSLIDSAREQYRFIACCAGEERVSLKTAYPKGGNVLVLIGPEGDFSEEEVAYAVERGFKPLTLGEARLRTETAALYAVACIQFLNS